MRLTSSYLFRRMGIGHPCSSEFDSRLNAVVRHTTAEGVVHGLSDLRVRGMRILVQHCLRRHDLPVLAEAALRRLLVDPRLLERMQLPVRGEPFERRDFATHRRRGQYARAYRRAVNDHSTRAALAKSAAEMRPLQTQVVAENVKQRCGGVDVDRMRTAVHLKGDFAHRTCSFRLIRSRWILS